MSDEDLDSPVSVPVPPEITNRRYGKLIARAWLDPQFLERVKAEPEAVLAEYRITTVGGVAVSELSGRIDVIEQGDDEWVKPYLEGDRMQVMLPEPPDDFVVDSDLVNVAGGAVYTGGVNGTPWPDGSYMAAWSTPGGKFSAYTNDQGQTYKCNGYFVGTPNGEALRSIVMTARTAVSSVPPAPTHSMPGGYGGNAAGDALSDTPDIIMLAFA